jgi:hypothetical protein
VGAVVFTVIETVVVVAVPFADTDGGLNVHFDSDGNPEHARLIMPLKPVEFKTLTDVDPRLPGAEMTTVDCAEPIDAKKPGVIVNVCDWVELLGLKLGSPL